MFYFREDELAKIREFSQSDIEKAMAIYGRRRVGKTELVLQYVHSAENAVYFQVFGYDYNIALEDFKRTLAGSLSDEMIITFSSFKDVFTYLSKVEHNPLVIIIDEFPFLARKNENVPFEFQWIIDHGLNKIKLILMGSSLSFMKNQIHDSQAPLYGRFDEILKVVPFTFDEICRLYPDYDSAVNVYAMTGGVAQYVNFFLGYANPEDAADHLLFSNNGRLIQETGNILMQELRDITTYTTILRALGTGEKDASAIAKKGRIDTRNIYPYLNKLADLEIISTVRNPLSQKKNEVRYCISDLFFRFHYAFIEPNISMITSIGPESKKYILTNGYHEYLGFMYEEIIRNNLYRYAVSGRIPFMPQITGKWWGNVQQNGKWYETEIDVLALDRQHLIAGECKYREKEVGIGILDDLKLKTAFIPADDREIYYLLASKSGFTDELMQMNDPHLILIDRS